ncbi:MAG: GNAT family N-acetyltransferase [Desulfobacteria bacterium]
MFDGGEEGVDVFHLITVGAGVALQGRIPVEGSHIRIIQERDVRIVGPTRSSRKFPIPVGRIARLAVDLKARGRGLGEYLLMDALHRFFRTGNSIGMVAVLVDAKDEQAKYFYRRYDFNSLTDRPLTLWLPMKSVRKLFSR